MNASASSPDPWGVFGYEVDMFMSLSRLLEVGNQEYANLSHHVRNAVVESVLLHTRILVDILLSRGSESDDIRLADLLPGFRSQTLDELRQVYGNRYTVDSPCWTLNKMLVHPTLLRGNNYDYTSLLNQLCPLIVAVLREIDGRRSHTA